MHKDYQLNRLDKTKYKEFDGERRKPAPHDNTQQRPGSRLQVPIEVTGPHHAEGIAAGDQSEWSGPQWRAREDRDPLSYITPQVKPPDIVSGPVSGLQTQSEIGFNMNKLADNYTKVLEGMGRTKVRPNLHTDEAGIQVG